VMEILIKIMLGGGFFAILGFVHFFVDWIFQSHSEAMVKHNNAKIRAKHCAIYTAGFFPLLAYCWYVNALYGWELVASLLILFVSHFVEDTYLPVLLWAKYIRRPPEMTGTTDSKAGFILFIQTTLGKILMIAIDQIIHLTFLFPIVYFVLRHLHIDPSVFSESISCNYPTH
jgi:hypothetical protein